LGGVQQRKNRNSVAGATAMLNKVISVCHKWQGTKLVVYNIVVYIFVGAQQFEQFSHQFTYTHAMVGVL
jgi:hypothetical protein